jgi:two-component system sensor histidine kinase KdpD
MSQKTRAFRRSALRLLRGSILVGIVTAVCYRAQLGPAPTALLFLIAVVLQSLDCNFLEAVVISTLATASLDYFFTEPLFSFVVSGPLEAVTLVCLLIVSLVITRIQYRSREEARESKLQRANMESVYKVSQELLALASPIVAGPAFLQPFLSAFDVAAVCLFDGDTLECYKAGSSRADLEAKTREGFRSGQTAVYSELEIVVQCLRARDKILGSIGFEGLRNPHVTAPALASLATAALERVRAFRSAATSAAHAEAEILRAAILDALAHEFKTPLATILTAAGGLRVRGSAMPEQVELAEMIETEASRLGDLTTRLLRLARVDQQELKPRLQSTDVVELATRSVRRYSKLWPDRNISFRQQAEAGEVLIDPELIGLAISQLVENACRYSQADGSVLIELAAHENIVTITIWNDGPPIAEGERDRIFERFYRGTEARRLAPGSGLGLYVARKIALAHGGNLVVVNGRTCAVGFRLTVPSSADEASSVEWQL